MRRILATLLVCCALPLSAAEPERGKLTDNIATSVDPSQTYTLYLPPSYDPAKKHPLLFVFDPRGRGRTAAEIFRPGAEAHGWILISANGTRSDDGMEPNDRALRALWPEVARYAADPRRLYATGFSGTAMVSWLVGINTGQLAGVIGVGGRLLEEVAPRNFKFAHFGIAGVHDFNNRDMRAIDALLEKEGKLHRFASFDGDHRWPPPELAGEAIDWMELVAMKEQRRPRDDAFIAKQYERALAASSGHTSGALRSARSALRTFEGLHNVDELRAAVARLESDPLVQRELKDEGKWDEFEARFMRDTVSRIPGIITALQLKAVADLPGGLMRELRVAELQKRAGRDGAEGAAARRLLDTLHGQLSSYLRRQFFERREYRVAAAGLTVATRIHPDRPNTWYNLGAASARAGDRRAALDALTKAIDLGYRNAAHLAGDEDYASVRADPRFTELLNRIK